MIASSDPNASCIAPAPAAGAVLPALWENKRRGLYDIREETTNHASAAASEGSSSTCRGGAACHPVILSAPRLHFEAEWLPRSTGKRACPRQSSGVDLMSLMSARRTLAATSPYEKILKKKTCTGTYMYSSVTLLNFVTNTAFVGQAVVEA